MKRLNYNCTVYVKLTEHGKAVYHNYYNKDVVVDENGFSQFQLWIFIEIFGEAIGKSIVLEDGCIYMKEDDLE